MYCKSLFTEDRDVVTYSPPTALLEYHNVSQWNKDLAVRALYLFRIACQCLIPAEIPGHYALSYASTVMLI